MVVCQDVRLATMITCAAIFTGHLPITGWHKFRAVQKHTLLLHIRETGYCFNHRRDDLYQDLLCLLRRHPI